MGSIQMPGKETALDAIDSQQWLRDSADALQGPIRNFLAGLGATKDILHGTWLGHPLHPALTDVPIGAWTTALLFDAMDLMSDREEARRAAKLAIGLGLTGAVAAAVTGLTDWTETDGRAKNLGLLHGVLNLGAAALYTMSFFERGSSGKRNRGVGLSILAYLTALSSAYLGGHLVYGEQAGVDHTATEKRGTPKKFVAVLAQDKLRERNPEMVDAGGVAVLLVKIDGEIYALANTCTHLGGPLNEGTLDGDTIVCPWHGSRFCVTDGSLRGGPATFPERAFDVRVRRGHIEVRARD